MPSVNDYSKDDDDSGGSDSGYTPGQSNAISSAGGGGGSSGGSSGSAAGSATGAPKEAQASKQQESDYTPWSSFVNANKDVSDREAGKLSGQVQGDVSKAQGELSSAQSGFNAGVDSNYNKPDSSTPAAPVTPQNKGGAPSNKQTATPDVSATPAAPTNPTGRSASGAQTATSTGNPWATLLPQRPTGTAVDGGLPPNAPPPPKQGPSYQAPQAQTGVTDTGNRVTSQNPANVAPVTPPQPDAQPQAQPQTSNPWARLSGPTASAQSAPPIASKMAGPASTSAGSMMQGLGRELSLTPGAAAGNPTGNADLEAQLGQQGWNSLLGDTMKASQEANALGSETGVQGLLQQSQSSPMQNTAFDAALINGQGAGQFRDLAKKYGGGQLGQNLLGAEQAAQDRWAQLQGDVKGREARDAAGQQAGASGAAGATGANQPTADAKPDGYYEPGDGIGSANHAMDDIRTANAAGWNTVGVEMGIPPGGMNPDGTRMTGEQWGANIRAEMQALKDTGADNGPQSWLGQFSQNLGSAEKALGLSEDQLFGEISKMTGNELGDFWAFGVIPPWMNAPNNYGKGIMGGWQSPFIQQTLNYGQDGGMWNAVLNMWKTGSSTVAAGIPVVGSAASAGIKAVPVNTHQNKYGS